jgi:hypothetical protein
VINLFTAPLLALAALLMPVHRAAPVPAGTTCYAERVDGSWLLVVHGPGYVTEVTAGGRSMDVGGIALATSAQEFILDWSGTYAPNPGHCTAS